MSSHRKLDIGVEISGPRGFTVRERRIRLLRCSRPSLPASNVDDDAQRPSYRPRDGVKRCQWFARQRKQTSCDTITRRANHLAVGKSCQVISNCLPRRHSGAREASKLFLLTFRRHDGLRGC